MHLIAKEFDAMFPYVRLITFFLITGGHLVSSTVFTGHWCRSENHIFLAWRNYTYLTKDASPHKCNLVPFGFQQLRHIWILFATLIYATTTLLLCIFYYGSVISWVIFYNLVRGSTINGTVLTIIFLFYTCVVYDGLGVCVCVRMCVLERAMGRKRKQGSSLCWYVWMCDWFLCMGIYVSRFL